MSTYNILIIGGVFFSVLLIAIVIGFWVVEMVNKIRCKEKMASLNSLELLVNKQFESHKLFEDRLDMWQVSLAKTMSDMKGEIDAIRNNKITNFSSDINNKELANLSWQWGINKLKEAEDKISKTQKTSITKIRIHKEIKNHLNKEWFMIRKVLGEEAYKDEYRKAYNRLYYKQKYHQKNTKNKTK